MQINFTLFDVHYSVVYRTVPAVSDWVYQVATRCSFFVAQCRDPASDRALHACNTRGFVTHPLQRRLHRDGVDPFPHMRIDAFSEKSRLANRIADRLGKEKYPCIR